MSHLDPNPTDDAPHDPDTTEIGACGYGWREAQSDYLAGDPADEVAARLGVCERTVHRHAAKEGWRRRDRRFLGNLIQGRAPVGQAELDPDSPLGLFVAATEFEVGELLLSPEPERLIRFAFRRAAEAAVSGHPSEALSWARLVAVVDRLAPAIPGLSDTASTSDLVRAVYAEKLRDRMAVAETEIDAVLKLEA